jgi:hypothetical protein
MAHRFGRGNSGCLAGLTTGPEGSMPGKAGWAGIWELKRIKNDKNTIKFGWNTPGPYLCTPNKKGASSSNKDQVVRRIKTSRKTGINLVEIKNGAYFAARLKTGGTKNAESSLKVWK